MSIETGFPEKPEAKMDLPELLYQKYLCDLKEQSAGLLIQNCYENWLPGEIVIDNVKTVINEVERK